MFKRLLHLMKSILTCDCTSVNDKNTDTVTDTVTDDC